MWLLDDILHRVISSNQTILGLKFNGCGSSEVKYKSSNQTILGLK